MSGSALMDICRQKLRLLDVYNRATNMYSEAVILQASEIGFVSKAGHQALRENSNDARQLSADARERLDRHIADHGC